MAYLDKVYGYGDIILYAIEELSLRITAVVDAPVIDRVDVGLLWYLFLVLVVNLHSDFWLIFLIFL